MKYKWQKKGLILRPQEHCSWSVSHAMLPTADHLKDDLYRIYFSGRDESNRSLIGFLDVDLKDPTVVVNYSKKPVLGLGSLGCFDDNGVTPSWVIDHEGKKYLYYIGWNQGSTVRMHLVAGLAVSEDDGEHFERVWRTPILDRIPQEPYTVNTAPCVIKDDNEWKMWYVGCEGWVHKDLPKYNIKYASSKDGLHWSRDSHICIDFKDDKEHALARPCVLREDGVYRMWFSCKSEGSSYRMAYAESRDGLTWNRMDDQVGIDVSKDGFDSEMIEYGFVFHHDGQAYMLYNGNSYGFEGIGLAVAS